MTALIESIDIRVEPTKRPSPERYRDPAKIVGNAEVRRLILAAWCQHSHDAKVIFHARFVHELSWDSVGAELGITGAAAKARFARIAAEPYMRQRLAELQADLYS